MAPKIFIVDDEMVLNLSTSHFLEENGYKTTIITSGEQCLNTLAKKDIPDVILMDINLGEGKMDGSQTTKRIYETYDIPVVLHSAYTDKETIGKTRDMTKYGYVHKVPGNEQFILATIEMALKIKRQEKLYRELFYNTNDAIFLHELLENGKPGKFIEINDIACLIAGYSREELLTMGPPDISGNDEKNILRIMDELQKNKRYMFESKLYCKNGTSLPVETSSHLFFLDGRQIVLSSVRDISLRKRARNEVRESEELHRTTLSNISDTVFLTNEEGAFVYICPNVHVIFGYTEVEVERMASIDRLFGDRLVTTSDLDKNGEKRNIEKTIRDNFGKEHVLLINVKRVAIKKATRLYTCRDISGLRQKDRDLQRSEQMYRELSNHLQHIREEEKESIAREIHDDLGQSLTALKMNLIMMDKYLPNLEGCKNEEEISTITADMKSILEKTSKRVRFLAQKLHPPILDTHDVFEAIEWHIQEFQDQFGIPIEYHNTCRTVHLEKEKTLALFRIVQEALTNSVRHGNPEKIDVFAEESCNSLTITITDDGCGFEPKKHDFSKSYGLFGMHERAKQCGCSLSIESEPGTGTTVVVHVPQEEEHDTGHNRG